MTNPIIVCWSVICDTIGLQLFIYKTLSFTDSRAQPSVKHILVQCVLCVFSALLPPGSTQHVSSSATVAAKPAARRGVVSGSDIPMITELGQSLSRLYIDNSRRSALCTIWEATNLIVLLHKEKRNFGKELKTKNEGKIEIFSVSFFIRESAHVFR